MTALRPVRLTALLIAGLALALLLVPGARAQDEGGRTRIEIGPPGTIRPIPIAIPGFVAQDPSTSALAQQIGQVIANDLQHSGLFQLVDPRAYLAGPTTVEVTPAFDDWRKVNAEALVVGQVEPRAGGTVAVAFRLWDTLDGTPLEGLEYASSPENWRRVAHGIADRIYEKYTGERGYFSTRVLFVDESGPRHARLRRLAVMDYDGANLRYLTDGSTMALTPRFSPNGSDATYLMLSDQGMQVHLLNIDTGRRETLDPGGGSTFAPRFSPDGNQVVLSVAANGNTDIYALDLRTRAQRQLTNHPAIDTAPSYAPDGQRIVFESDRGGSSQLYIMPANGGEAQRLTFGQGRYGTPVWSPQGDLIAFTRQAGGRFFIGVIRPDGTGERMIAEDFHVEGPTWAPNGRVLMYWSEPRGQPPRILSVDVFGGNKRPVPTQRAASDPAWSPLLQ